MKNSGRMNSTMKRYHYYYPSPDHPGLDAVLLTSVDSDGAVRLCIFDIYVSSYFNRWQVGEFMTCTAVRGIETVNINKLALRRSPYMVRICGDLPLDDLAKLRTYLLGTRYVHLVGCTGRFCEEFLEISYFIRKIIFTECEMPIRISPCARLEYGSMTVEKSFWTSPAPDWDFSGKVHLVGPFKSDVPKQVFQGAHGCSIEGGGYEIQDSIIECYIENSTNQSAHIHDTIFTPSQL